MTNTELNLLNYLQEQWDQSGITLSWANSNVTTNYLADQNYLVPRLTMLSSEIIEVPSECGAIRTEYLLGLNLLLVENTGMALAKTCIDRLREIFHKKSIEIGDLTYHFFALEIEQGFSYGSHFEVPVLIQVRVYST